MFWAIFIIQTILAGLFGWLLGELTAKCIAKEIDFKFWKALAIEVIFLFVLFSADYLGRKKIEDKVYNTREYAIEAVDTTFDADSTEVTSFKIVKK